LDSSELNKAAQPKVAKKAAPVKTVMAKVAKKAK
jgi:hypothetical protein